MHTGCQIIATASASQDLKIREKLGPDKHVIKLGLPGDLS